MIVKTVERGGVGFEKTAKRGSKRSGGTKNPNWFSDSESDGGIRPGGAFTTERYGQARSESVPPP